MFSVHTTPEDFKNATITSHFVPCDQAHRVATEKRGKMSAFILFSSRRACSQTTVKENWKEHSVREITWLSWRHLFRKAPFSKCFPSIRNENSTFSNYSGLNWERFRKASFSRRISVDGRPNRGNKSAFSHFSGVEWMKPKFLSMNRNYKTFENAKSQLVREVTVSVLKVNTCQISLDLCRRYLFSPVMLLHLLALVYCRNRQESSVLPCAESWKVAPGMYTWP